MLRVLIIEDIRSLATILKANLEQTHKFVVDVCGGADAEAYLEAAPEDLFLVIYDLDIVGTEPEKTVNQVLAKSVACLVFTEKTSEALHEDMIDLGVCDFILKQGALTAGIIIKSALRLEKNRRCKVLVVDDSKSARQSLTHLLELHCFPVICVGHASEAIELIHQDDAIRMLISDYVMEGMDGLELLKEIRKTHSSERLGVLVVTGKAGSLTSVEFIKAGVDEFLTKPYLTEEFICRVSNLSEKLDLVSNLNEAIDYKNMLLGMAAHDIRSPLSANVSICRLLRRLQDTGCDTPEKTRDLVQLLETSSEKMLNLLDSLLTYASIVGSSVVLDLEVGTLFGLIQQQVKIYRNLALAKDIQLNLALDMDTSIQCSFDNTRIAQVVTNLISNAIKYSPRQSEVSIKLYSEQHWLVFEVVDLGVGIDNEDAKSLFTPFSQIASTPTEGEDSHGLGLAISKSIVDAHKGQIFYKPNEPTGSCFGFKLPMVLPEEMDDKINSVA